MRRQRVAPQGLRRQNTLRIGLAAIRPHARAALWSLPRIAVDPTADVSNLMRRVEGDRDETNHTRRRVRPLGLPTDGPHRRSRQACCMFKMLTARCCARPRPKISPSTRPAFSGPDPNVLYCASCSESPSALASLLSWLCWRAATKVPPMMAQWGTRKTKAPRPVRVSLRKSTYSVLCALGRRIGGGGR